MKSKLYSHSVIWLFGQAEVAQLYRKTGKPEEADKIENQLRELLRYAECDSFELVYDVTCDLNSDPGCDPK